MPERKARQLNWVFVILTTISAALFITSFFLPPQGIIDGSVLTATAELIGMFALYEFFQLCWAGKFGHFRYKDLDVDINNGKEKARPPEFGD